MSRYKLVMVQINHIVSIEILFTSFRLVHNGSLSNNLFKILFYLDTPVHEKFQIFDSQGLHFSH
jgi:hypothetical protein